MFRFFTIKKWYLWSWIGSLVILSSLWVQVKLDVKINEWFGEFYDMIQKALAAPNSITMSEYWMSLLSFIKLAAMAVSLELSHPIKGFIPGLLSLNFNIHFLVFALPDCMDVFVGL